MLDSTPHAQSLPLSERMPQILRYPFQSGPLSTLVALAVSHAVVGLLPQPVSGFLDLVVWAAFFKYGFEVLRWSANGRENAPEISFTVSDAISRYAVVLLLLIEVLLALIGTWYGSTVMLCVGAVLMAAAPAIVIVLALEEGPVRALNPIAWLQIAARLGRAYALLVVFFLCALVVQSVIASALRNALWDPFATLLTSLVVNYLMIANFHLIGMIIYEHQDELGYTGHLELQDEIPRADPHRRVVDSARVRAATGDTAGAITLLDEELALHPNALTLHEEYRHWLKQAGTSAELAIHGKKHIPALLADNQNARALDIARESFAAGPAFSLDEPEHITTLAHAAADTGQTQLALGLIGGFHKRFPAHPDLARNYLLAAKLLAERLNKEMPARALLQQVKQLAPNDPAIEEVDAYLKFLGKISATPVVTGT